MTQTHDAETVERVAMAICGPHDPRHIGEDALADLQKHRFQNQSSWQERAHYRIQARAALSALPAQEVTVQEAAKVLLSVRRWEDMAKAFSAMDARWDDGSEAVLAAALRALSEKPNE